jgi:pilus assembly protein CpaE
MPGRTILVLDENDTSRIFLSTTLRKKGHTTLEASSGREALVFAWRDHPDLILFDPVLPDFKPEEFIQKLRRDARTGNTPLIALSRDPAPALRELCLNAGVTEYFNKSSEALLALEQTIERIFSQAPTTAPEEKEEQPEIAEKKAGALIVFLSAKGGTGTSSLCANLAMNIKVHEPGARVVVADLVLPIGSIAQIVGYKGPINLVTVAELPSAQTDGEYYHNNLPQPDLWQFQLLAGSPDPQHGNNLKGDRIGQIMQVLRTSYDYMILDLGRSLSRISLPLIQQADLITLIVSTDQSTIHLTKTITEYLKSQGIDDQRIYAILNRAVGLEGLTKSEAEGIIGMPIKMTVPYMGSNFTLANNLNQPIITKYPRDTASFVLKDATESIIKLVQSLRAR